MCSWVRISSCNDIAWILGPTCMTRATDSVDCAVPQQVSKFFADGNLILPFSQVTTQNQAFLTSNKEEYTCDVRQSSEKKARQRTNHTAKTRADRTKTLRSERCQRARVRGTSRESKVRRLRRNQQSAHLAYSVVSRAPRKEITTQQKTSSGTTRNDQLEELKGGETYGPDRLTLH